MFRSSNLSNSLRLEVSYILSPLFIEPQSCLLVLFVFFLNFISLLLLTIPLNLFVPYVYMQYEIVYFGMLSLMYIIFQITDVLLIIYRLK